MKTNGGAVLAHALRAQGVSDAFVLHGGHLDAFLVACAEESIRLTDTRHEATAGHAAAAYARATADVGVCAITAGPGFTNALTAIADAHLDAAPVLFITSSPPLREVETNVLQGGLDQIAMALPVTKWAHRVTHVERIPDLVDKAIRIALSGRPGPVLLEVPIDIVFAPLEHELTYPTRTAPRAKPALDPGTADRILRLLAEAERPAIIVGGGMLFSPDSGRELAAFAEATGIPVVYSSKANGVLPVEHPYNLGNVGAIAAAAAGAKQPADVVLQVGARAGMALGGRSGAIVSHEATLIHIDIDGAELGRIDTPVISAIADAGESFAALNRGLADRPVSAPTGWVELLRKLRARTAGRFGDVAPHTDSGYIHPHHAAAAVAAALDPDTAISYDGGETPAWFVPLCTAPGPGLATGNGYLGTLGVGQGFAIGLAIARPGRPVATVIGDGAVGFHLSEFDTMARHNLPITTIVFNNGAWGISRHGQELVFGEQNLAVVDLERTAYHEAARALGCEGVEVDRIEDLAPAIRKAQESGRPTCVNVMIDRDLIHPNIVAMVGYSDREDEIAIPYYENIPVR
ncbi:thiamine pyrophosphate-binding protein [Nocardia bovistercoris]|uniref:acetolactate synthase n=1 Tax=Nocardia bovistercoris TaxID=2785916 RepID=A0A931IDM8_9NOCA|nr:thiamine pyrophosphate-binding protein [Nocardia bovistercoris]